MSDKVFQYSVKGGVALVLAASWFGLVQTGGVYASASWPVATLIVLWGAATLILSVTWLWNLGEEI